MMLRRIGALLAAAALVACGGGGGDPDAFLVGDAGPDVDGFLGDCHDEVDDEANDAEGEHTGFVAGVDEIRICGRIDERDPGEGDFIDVDLYRVSVGSPERVLVRVLADGAVLDRVGAELYGSEDGVLDGFDDFLGAARVVGNHGVFVAEAAADGSEYLVAVFGIHPTRPDASVEYEIRIVADDPDARCADAKSTSYGEELDVGPGNVENDVVQLRQGHPLTVVISDAPEPSGGDLTIAPAQQYGVEGVIGTHIQPVGEDYLDRDTYVVATGANTNQVDVRIRWEDGGDASDLDWFLFDDNGEEAPVLVQVGSSTENPEFESAAVLPSSTYWLVIASYQGSAETQAYAVTVCGSQFSP